MLINKSLHVIVLVNNHREQMRNDDDAPLLFSVPPLFSHLFFSSTSVVKTELNLIRQQAITKKEEKRENVWFLPRSPVELAWFLATIARSLER